MQTQRDVHTPYYSLCLDVWFSYIISVHYMKNSLSIEYNNETVIYERIQVMFMITLKIVGTSIIIL